MRKKNVFICCKKNITYNSIHIFYVAFRHFFVRLHKINLSQKFYGTTFLGVFLQVMFKHLLCPLKASGFFFYFTILFGNHISVFFDSIGTFIFSRLPAVEIWISKKVIGLSYYFDILHNSLPISKILYLF